jgi:lysophospholipase L1-like esterase
MVTLKKYNWFERNPKKTCAFIILVIFTIGVYCMERLLAYKNNGIGYNFALKNRVIALREFRPLLKEYNHPAKEDEPYDTIEKKTYLLRIDENGFIMPSEKYPNPDISLVFLGDSVTAELLVDEEKRFPYLSGVLLEKELKVKINSFNASRTANNTLNSLDVLLNKIIPIKPDVAIIMHNNNDVAIMLYEKTYWNTSPTRHLIFDMNEYILNNYFKIMRDKYIPNVSRELRLAGARLRTLLRTRGTDKSNDEFAKMRNTKINYNAVEMVEQFEMNLQTFITICKIRKITPVLMTMASRFTENPDKAIMDRFKDVVISYQEYKHLFDLFNNSIRDRARENNILFIDLAAKIPPEKEYIYDVIHYNNAGSIKAAEIIKDNLKPLVQQLLVQKNSSKP